MKKIYKDIVIGLILASFIFTPAAFAKPQNINIKKTVKTPHYANMLKTIQNKKRNLKVSDFVESAEPMMSKRAYRDIVKMTLPLWDKKFAQFKVGKDYFKIKFKGQSLFVKYVDKGPVAFLVNGQSFLWKDFLIYERAKARLTDIIIGKGAKKVSFIESILNDLFPKAYAGNAEQCEKDYGGEPIREKGKYIGCKCPNGIFSPSDRKINCEVCGLNMSRGVNGECVCSKRGMEQIEDTKGAISCACPEGQLFSKRTRECIPNIVTTPSPCKKGEEWDKSTKQCVSINRCGHNDLEWDAKEKKCVCINDMIRVDTIGGKASSSIKFEQCVCPGKKIRNSGPGNIFCGCPQGYIENVKNKCIKDKKKSWFIPKLLIGGSVVLLLFLIMKNRTKKKRRNRPPVAPIPTWASASVESQCPTPGANGRGISENDLPPECRNSSCSGDSCSSSDSDSIN